MSRYVLFAMTIGGLLGGGLLPGCGEEAAPGGSSGGPAEGEDDGQGLPPGVNPLPADRFCEEVVGLLFELDEWCGLYLALKTDDGYLMEIGRDLALAECERQIEAGISAGVIKYDGIAATVCLEAHRRTCGITSREATP